MTGTRVQVELVNRLELGDLAHGRRRKRRLAFESMQDDAFQQVPERHILVGGECLQYLQDTALNAHTGLDALDHELSGYTRHGRLLLSWYQSTMIHERPEGA